MKQENSKIPIVILTSLLCTLILSLFLLNATPPVSRDALIHHLAIPKLYLLNGGIYEIPDLIFSYYPMNLDLLYTGALYFNYDIVPKYIHMAFGLATAFLLYHHLKPRVSSVYALTGVLFFLSIPIIVKLATTAYVDLGLVFFTTASMLLLFKWRENRFAGKHLVLAGLCCGLAVGTKYNGLLILFLLTCFIPFLYLRAPLAKTTSSGKALGYTTLFFACALLIASPWLIRNFYWTGNPVYPLYESFFNPVPVGQLTAELTENSSGVQGVFATRYVLYGESIWQLLALPVRIFFEGTDGDPRFFDGRLNPFLLILPFFAFACGASADPKIRSECRTLFLFSILYFLFAFNTSVLRIRYLVPIIPFLVILSTYGLHAITTGTSRIPLLNLARKTFVPLIILVMIGYNGLYLFKQFRLIEPLSYISGEVSYKQYLSKRLPEFKVMDFANNHLSAPSKLLCVFLGGRGYYLDLPILFDDNNTPNRMVSLLQQPGITHEDIVRRLKEEKITHLLVRIDLLESWLHKKNPDLYRNWQDFKKDYLRLQFRHMNFALYELIR